MVISFVQILYDARREDEGMENLSEFSKKCVPLGKVSSG